MTTVLPDPRRVGLIVLLVLVSWMASAAIASDVEGPRYDSKVTRSIIERMISAHGGIDRWRQAPTVSFAREATFTGNPDHPWLLHETIEQGRRRLYQSWPEEKILLVDDGAEVWSLNWTKLFPPRFVAQIGFYFLNMPWITQDPGVILEDAGRGRHPFSETEYIKVAMHFEPGTGDTPTDRYVLFIDPELHLLQAIEYHVSYGALLDASYLPPSVRSIGPFYHVNHEFREVEGLMVPVRYGVHGKTGPSTISGKVHSWSFREPFDEAKLIKPPAAVVDRSSPSRKVGG